MQVLRALNDAHLIGVARQQLEQAWAVAAKRLGILQHDSNGIAFSRSKKLVQDSCVFRVLQLESREVFVEDRE